MKWLKYLQPPAPRKKPFFAWQIELTTRCPLKCEMCVRSGLNDWQSGDMSYDDFKKLTPYLKDVERVVLEGWGESLLHENLPGIVRLVKAEGPEAGFVTSGKGLNKAYLSELINAGVDFIGFSVSGGSSRTHNAIRVHSDFEVLLQDITILNEIKAEKKLSKPNLHIVYLMLMDNIFEIPSLIGIAKSIGIDNIILINLIHVTNEWQEKQKVFACNESEEYGEIIQEAEIKARELKINLKRPRLSPAEVSVCEENPLQNLYISTDGEVAPCVYLYPPVGSPFRRIFCGNDYQIEKLSFGNILREPFPDIWDKDEYRMFRDRFARRKQRFEGPSLFSRPSDTPRCPAKGPLPEPPEPCRTCHKMLGF